MISRLQISGQYTDNIAVNSGLRQGCSIAPVLFNLYFGLMFEKWHQEMRCLCPSGQFSFRYNLDGNLYHKPRSEYQSTTMPDLEFADDAAFVTSTRECAQVALSVFNDGATSFRLTINFSKTKLLCCGPGVSEADHRPLLVHDCEVECVSSFVYLVCLMTPD